MKTTLGKMGSLGKRIFKTFLMLLGGLVTAGFIVSLLLQRTPIAIDNIDRSYFQIAFEEAELAASEGDAPVGAVVVVNSDVIARAHNISKRRKDPLGHAEILAVKRALVDLNLTSFKYGPPLHVTVYTTYEPCPMCQGFLKWIGVDRVVWAHGKPFKYLISDYYWANLKSWFGWQGANIWDRHVELMNKYAEESQPPSPARSSP